MIGPIQDLYYGFRLWRSRREIDRRFAQLEREVDEDAHRAGIEFPPDAILELKLNLLFAAGVYERDT
jgi:hypothetical protein